VWGRPGYPLEAVEWLVGDARRIVDLGAGTGKLTKELVAFGVQVVALELDLSMVARLRKAVSGAHAVQRARGKAPAAVGMG
jgi:16S rRNA A1518/A1519 N6-dimethyltransferase RsmA/KsgA/DIM1 with predicted DNA glycosylase/AP lyase activity